MITCTDENTVNDNMDSQINERRQYKRYRLKDGIFAVLGSNAMRLGQIIDISEGGLSFSHKNIEDLPSDACELSILFDKKNYSAEKSHYRFETKTISSFDIRNENVFKQLSTKKRCAVQFTDLTVYRQSWLDHIIVNYAEHKT